MYPRGQLHIFLGAAQGVGKTYAMLEEGRALRAQGRDVVAGIVQTHGRAATKELCAGIADTVSVEGGQVESNNPFSSLSSVYSLKYLAGCVMVKAWQKP